MSVRSPTAGTWSSSQWRPDNEFETDRPVARVAAIPGGRSWRGWRTRHRGVDRSGMILVHPEANPVPPVAVWAAFVTAVTRAMSGRLSRDARQSPGVRPTRRRPGSGAGGALPRRASRPGRFARSPAPRTCSRGPSRDRSGSVPSLPACRGRSPPRGCPPAARHTRASHWARPARRSARDRTA